MGQRVNELRRQLEESFSLKEQELKAALLERPFTCGNGGCDPACSAAGKGNAASAQYCKNELIDIFVSMGFDVAEGRGGDGLL